MIEVNLLPGAKRGRRRRAKLALPSFNRIGVVDRAIAVIALIWIGSAAIVAYAYSDVRSAKAELEIRVQDAQRDSAALHEAIQLGRSIELRRDSIAARLEVIQDLDAGRYIWPHILDEIARALPDYTWLVGLLQSEGGRQPRVRIQGRTGNLFSLTQFMTNLEASPFLTNVRLTATQLVTEGGQSVHEFMIDVRYQDPPAGFIELVPLFPEGS